jgi:hypothetical protein
LIVTGGSSWGRVTRIAAAALLAATLYATAFDTAKVRMTNVDLIARAIEQSAGPRDLVLLNEWYMGVSFNRYYRGTTRWMTVPAIEEHRMHRFDLIKAKMRSSDALLEIRRAMRRTLHNGNSVWVVGHLELPPDSLPMSSLPPAPHGPWGWLDGPYTLVWTRQIGLFLEGNAARKRTIFVPAGGRVSGMENLRVWVFEGERLSPPAPLPRAGEGRTAKTGVTPPRLPTETPGSRGRLFPGGRGTPPRTGGGPGRHGG